jgi:membrane protein required for beta-lactamase induction
MQSLVAFSERFGSMLSRIFLTLLYFLVLGPFAIGYRLVADPLRLRRRDSNWWSWVADNETVRAARRQD